MLLIYLIRYPLHLNNILHLYMYLPTKWLDNINQQLLLYLTSFVTKINGITVVL